MATVRLQKLSKSFAIKKGSVRAVDALSLEVKDGEFVVVLGPSGSGKSTMLRLVAGLEEPDSGTVAIGGVDVTRVNPRDRNVAMVFQNYALYPHMTVFRNMAFGLKTRRVPKSQIQQRVTEVAAKLSIEHLLDRKPGKLSGGERQRVALGRAIVRDPNVFLLDEPIASVDPSLRVQLRGEIKSLHRELGATFIHVTHEQEEAMILGDRIAVMRGGSLQQFDTPLRVYDYPANRFVAGFVGSPAMNFLPGTLKAEGGQLAVETDAGRVPLPAEMASKIRDVPAGEVVLGIRPEDLAVAVPNDPAESSKSSGGDRGSSCLLNPLEIASVEALGHSIRVQVALPSGESMTATLARDCEVAVGTPIQLRLDSQSVHIFKADGDGRRLG